MPFPWKHKCPETIKLSGEAKIDIQASAEGEEPKLPTFVMQANSGAKMRVPGFSDPVVVDMGGVTLAKKRLPVVADHDIGRTARVGHTTEVTIEASGITVTGEISATGQTAKEIIADAKNGYPFQASLGASVKKARFIRAGKHTTVNGQIHHGPVIVATKAVVHEFTVTSVGADSNTSFSLAASGGDTNSSIGASPVEFTQYLEACGLKEDDLSDAEVKVLKAAWESQKAILADAALTASGKGGDATEGVQLDLEKDLEAARAKVRETFTAEQARLNEFSKLEAQYSDQVEDFATIRATADTEDWNADRFELELRRKARPDARNFSIHTKTTTNAPVIEASLLLASGCISEDAVGEAYDEKVMNAAMEADNRGYGLHRLCHEVIHAAGQHYQIGRYDTGFLEATCRADRTIRAAGHAGGANISTISVSGIMSNVLHKILLASFTGDSNGLNTLNAISSTRPLSDFRDHPMYRLTGIGEYADVEPGGELKHISLGEEQGKIHAQTRGALISLDRVQIINDDLNAFAKIPQIIGRKARMRFLKVGYATFLDNAAFYTLARGNALSNNPYGVDGLTAAVQAFMKMKDINGDPVDVMPRFVIVPSVLAVEADQLHKSTNLMVLDRDTAATAGTVTPVLNPHTGKYQPYATSWIDADSPAENGSDDDWYLCSDEEDMKPVQVGYLNGQRTPTLERVDLPADQLGMGWRSYFDFGFARAEWRGSIKSYGAGVAPSAVGDGDGPPAPQAKKPAATTKKR